MATSACLVTVAIVLIFTVKRLQLMIGVMRTETRTEGVRAGCWRRASPPRTRPRMAAAERAAAAAAAPSRANPRTDVNNTSCGLDGIDEEEDHRL